MLRPVWQDLGYDEKVGKNYRLPLIPDLLTDNEEVTQYVSKGGLPNEIFS